MVALYENPANSESALAAILFVNLPEPGQAISVDSDELRGMRSAQACIRRPVPTAREASHPHTAGSYSLRSVWQHGATRNRMHVFRLEELSAGKDL
jgi:hypothetical protein